MKTPSKSSLLLLTLLLSSAAARAQAQAPAPAPAQGSASSLERVVDAFLVRENNLAQTLADRHPLIETYVQTLEPDQTLGSKPKRDAYFLGKLDVSSGASSRSLVPTPGFGKKLAGIFGSNPEVTFVPESFVEMTLVDRTGFDRDHYEFEFVRREFLGEIRTLVFEVKPRPDSGKGRFLGRIWVEDVDFNIVRFNGVNIPSTLTTKYLHFDSWRVQTGPGLWLPAYVYSEESNLKRSLGLNVQYKAQTRIWGYELSTHNSLDEFTKVMVEAPVAAKDETATDDLSPVNGLRAWERLAEDNVLERMTKGGLLSPEGEVDQILKTVVTNLEVTNQLDIQPEVRCRVLLTTPLESFTIGHTIVLSRGLVDALPDEASLASVLAHELAHIALGHRLETKYAFSDRMLFRDEDSLDRLGFVRDAQEEAEADAKAMQLLAKSPYKDQLANAGLFLEALQNRAPALKALIRPHLGNRMADGGAVLRMAGLVGSAPPLEPQRTDQVAALPLGGRIKVDPWSAQVLLLKNKPVSLLSAREKLPFEVTPFLPYLTRQEAPANGTAPAVGTPSLPGRGPSGEATTAAQAER